MEKPKLVVKSNHSQVLRDHHNELCRVLDCADEVLLDFAGKLYSKRIIDRETKTAVRRRKGYEAADILMDRVEIKIDQRPTSLVTVLQVMAELEILKHILEKIQKKRDSTKLEAEDMETHSKSLDTSVCVETDKPNVILAAEKLKDKFEDLLLSVYDALNGVDTGKLKLRLNWFVSSEKQNTPPVQEHLDKLESLLTPQSILNYLINKDFIGYLNYELLKVFQKVVQSDELQFKITKYEEHHDEFLRLANFNTIIDTFKQHPELAPASPIGLPKFKIRLDAPWNSRNIYSWKELVEKRFNWPSHIYIVSISRNCIILTYSVLSFFAPAVVRDLTNQDVLALLESQGVSVVELSNDLLKLGTEVEVELDREENTEEKLPTEEENLKLSAEDVPVSIRSETELSFFSEEDGEGKETHDEEVPVNAKTISTLEQIRVGNLKRSTDDKNVPVSKRSKTELTSFSEEDGEGKETHDEEVSVKAKTVSILEQDDDLTEVVHRQDQAIEILIQEEGNPNNALLKAVGMGDTSVVEGLINRGADVNYSDWDKRSPLHVAIEEGHTDVVDILVKHGADVEIKDYDKRSPLHVAIEKGHTDVVDILVKHGADVDSKDKLKRSSLYVAVEKGHTNIVDILLKRRADVDTKNWFKRSPLHVAAEKGHTGIVNILITHGANVDAKDKGERSPLHAAVEKGHTDIINILITQGANVDTKDSGERSPLHVAVEKGHTDIINILITHGANVDTKDSDRRGHLHVAAEKGHMGIINILIKHGAEVDTKDNYDRSPLHLAAEKGHTDIVIILVTHGANVDSLVLHKTKNQEVLEVLTSQKTKDDHLVNVISLKEDVDELESLVKKGANPNKALLEAVKLNDITIIERLIKCGANVKYYDEIDGRSPLHLHLTAEQGQTAIVNILITHGANVDTQDRYGRSPLHVAVEKGHTDIVNILITHGANVDTKDVYGRSPLHLAVKEGHTDIVNILIKHGADMDTMDSDDRSPLHLAVNEGHTDIVNILIKHGANVDATDWRGKSISHIMAEKGHTDVANTLITHGAIVDTKDGYGRSPLHVAAAEGHTDVVDILVKHGANVDTKDWKSRSPLHIAVESGHTDIINMLITHGANVDKEDMFGKSPLDLAHKRQCALKSGGSDTGFVMKTLRNHRPGLQQALYDKHTLLQLAEELNKKHLINMEAFVTVQAKDSWEGSNIILNLLEMEVAQEPEIYEEVVTIMKNILSLKTVFEEEEIKFSPDTAI